MNIKSLVEQIIRQKMVELRHLPQFSEELLLKQVSEALTQQGIPLQENTPKPSSEISAEKSINTSSLVIGSDHGGFDLKKVLIEFLTAQKYEVFDAGTISNDPVDYPDFAQKVAELVSQGKYTRGIIIDGAGIGSCITANKVPGVRAAHCHNSFEARNAREHNNSNVLSLGGRVIGTELAKEILRVWLETPFAGGRHQQRVDKMMAVEKKYLRS